MKYSMLLKCATAAGILVVPDEMFGQAIDPGATPKPGYRMEMKQGPLVAGPAPIVMEAGDNVTVRSDGAIVAASRLRSFTFLPTNRMEPNVRVSYALVNGRVQYDYLISNGPGGVNSIDAFALAISAPADVVAPDPWTALKINRPNVAPSLGFFQFVKDGDPKARLAAGVRLNPIRVLSDFGPGLIEATFYPDPASTGSPSAQGLADGDFINAASPWVQQRLLELDTPERHQVRGLAIGPVAPLGTDSAEGIRLEIQAATQRPQLSLLRDHILRLPAPAERVALGSWLGQLRKISSAGLVADFVDAMTWRLQRLR